eukprot:NODE_1061_length_1124_cov_36.059535_g810_i0.p1 GENE.NODE_1061_length_1124_cov_36.059535_g810_i0~~NODE_1061_length_1124_cov_36.059535_g810_i0.p1  ORF type:complete len:259 (-),score=32.24 NODE_1061_length_1124_cov_36.059535_g810_i0:228-1004(-)
MGNTCASEATVKGADAVSQFHDLSPASETRPIISKNCCQRTDRPCCPSCCCRSAVSRTPEPKPACAVHTDPHCPVHGHPTSVTVTVPPNPEPPALAPPNQLEPPRLLISESRSSPIGKPDWLSWGKSPTQPAPTTLSASDWTSWNIKSEAPRITITDATPTTVTSPTCTETSSIPVAESLSDVVSLFSAPAPSPAPSPPSPAPSPPSPAFSVAPSPPVSVSPAVQHTNETASESLGSDPVTESDPETGVLFSDSSSNG